MTDTAEFKPMNGEIAAMVQAHFAALRWTGRPLSIRGQVKLLRRVLAAGRFNDEDLIRQVERCAVERGFSVCFDGHLAEDYPAASF